VQRRERIIVLLSFYNDVREGFKDPPKSDSGGAVRFHSTWSGATYLQLRGLVAELRELSPGTWRHLAGVYFHCRYVRRSRCPACGGTFPSSKESRTQHCDGTTHGRKAGKSVTLEPYMEKVVASDVSPRLSNLGVDWLDTRWNGECDLPLEIIGVLSTRATLSIIRKRPLVIAA
jgi:hypothetical protein